jgi:hypothetical protein
MTGNRARDRAGEIAVRGNSIVSVTAEIDHSRGSGTGVRGISREGTVASKKASSRHAKVRMTC